MTRDSSSKGAPKGFTIELPEGVKKNLPKDFDIGAIGNIDLVEAEAVANESVLLLNENDLIEGIEDFDLIPLKEMQNRPNAAGRGTAAKAGVGLWFQREARACRCADKIEEKPVSTRWLNLLHDMKSRRRRQVMNID